MGKPNPESITGKLKNTANTALAGVFVVSVTIGILKERSDTENNMDSVATALDYPVAEVPARTEIADRMIADLAPYRAIDPYAARDHMQETGKTGDHFGEQISKADSMRYFYIAGFRGNDLKRITAISWRESNRYPGAFGDNNYKDSGSVSAGLTQIRCITEGDELPCVGARDWTQNFDPMNAAQSTYELVYGESVATYGYGGDNPNSMEYGGRFHPWKWYQEHVEKYGPDPAQNIYLPEVKVLFDEMQQLYGDLHAA
jgi:hypothetical protein